MCQKLVETQAQTASLENTFKVSEWVSGFLLFNVVLNKVKENPLGCSQWLAVYMAENPLILMVQDQSYLQFCYRIYIRNFDLQIILGIRYFNQLISHFSKTVSVECFYNYKRTFNSAISDAKCRNGGVSNTFQQLYLNF